MPFFQTELYHATLLYLKLPHSDWTEGEVIISLQYSFSFIQTNVKLSCKTQVLSLGERICRLLTVRGQYGIHELKHTCRKTNWSNVNGVDVFHGNLWKWRNNTLINNTLILCIYYLSRLAESDFIYWTFRFKRIKTSNCFFQKYILYIYNTRNTPFPSISFVPIAYCSAC